MTYHLAPADFKRLERDVAAFAGDPRSFLAEIEQSLRRDGEPVDALALLVGMFGTHVHGKKEQRALNDAGKWLEARLAHEREIELPRLRCELGWLQRLNEIRPKPDDTSPPGAVRLEFGGSLENLRKRPPSPRPAPSLTDEEVRRTRVETLLRALAPNNAPTALPVILAEPDLAARRTLAERCVAVLTRKRVREAQKADKPWVRPLTEILGELP